MPFRFLEYIARIYEKITNPKEKFERKLMKLPVPEFYVFYNGKEDFPSESEMKLSDAFIKLDEKHNFARFTRTKELCKITTVQKKTGVIENSQVLCNKT